MKRHLLLLMTVALFLPQMGVVHAQDAILFVMSGDLHYFRFSEPISHVVNVAGVPGERVIRIGHAVSGAYVFTHSPEETGKPARVKYVSAVDLASNQRRYTSIPLDPGPIYQSVLYRGLLFVPIDSISNTGERYAVVCDAEIVDTVQLKPITFIGGTGPGNRSPRKVDCQILDSIADSHIARRDFSYAARRTQRCEQIATESHSEVIKSCCDGTRDTINVRYRLHGYVRREGDKAIQQMIAVSNVVNGVFAIDLRMLIFNEDDQERKGWVTRSESHALFALFDLRGNVVATYVYPYGQWHESTMVLL